MPGRKLTPAESSTWRNSIKRDCKKLKQAPLCLQQDVDVVIAAMNDGHWKVIQFAAPELKKDKDFMLRAVAIGGLSLQYGSEAIRKDRDIVLAAATQNGFALQYIYYKGHLDDHEIGLQAVKQNWNTMRLLSDRLRGDSDIAWEALRQNWQAISFVPEEWQDNRDFVEAAVQQSAEALRFASETLRCDPGLQKLAREGGHLVSATGQDVHIPIPDAWTNDAEEMAKLDSFLKKMKAQELARGFEDEPAAVPLDATK